MRDSAYKVTIKRPGVEQPVITWMIRKSHPATIGKIVFEDGQIKLVACSDGYYPDSSSLIKPLEGPIGNLIFEATEITVNESK